MKRTVLFSLVSLILAILLLPVGKAESSVSVSVGVNSDQFGFLGDYGDWVTVPSYGRVWHPSVVSNWQPYVNGEWVWSPTGWTWVSYEPFGWATYHYGYWYSTPQTGWFWIPGRTYAPARVSWRYFGDHVAWAPLPPPGRRLPEPWEVRDNTRFWNVVESRNFARENVREFVLNSAVPRPGATIRINRRSPSVFEIEKVTKQKVQVVRVNTKVVTMGKTKLRQLEFPEPVAQRVQAHRQTVEHEVLVHKEKKAEVTEEKGNDKEKGPAVTQEKTQVKQKVQVKEVSNKKKVTVKKKTKEHSKQKNKPH